MYRAQYILFKSLFSFFFPFENFRKAKEFTSLLDFKSYTIWTTPRQSNISSNFWNQIGLKDNLECTGINTFQMKTIDRLCSFYTTEEISKFGLIWNADYSWEDSVSKNKKASVAPNVSF